MVVVRPVAEEAEGADRRRPVKTVIAWRRRISLLLPRRPRLARAVEVAVLDADEAVRIVEVEVDAVVPVVPVRQAKTRHPTEATGKSWAHPMQVLQRMDVVAEATAVVVVKPVVAAIVKAATARTVVVETVTAATGTAETVISPEAVDAAATVAMVIDLPEEVAVAAEPPTVVIARELKLEQTSAGLMGMYLREGKFNHQTTKVENR